jgi:hypothetical protein
MSTAELQQMLREMVRFGPVREDQEFLKALVNEIAHREKEHQ